MIFALIIWSTIFLVQRRYLLASLVYCVAVLTKQIAIYYSAAFVGYLLVHYVVEGKKIQWFRLVKLVLIVSGSIVLAFLPFIGHLGRVYKQVTGGQNNLVGYTLLPNLHMVYSYLTIGYDISRYKLLPKLISLPLFLGCLWLVISFIYRERHLPQVRFPLYMVLSGMVFFQLMPIVHEKHFVYLAIPLM